MKEIFNKFHGKDHNNKKKRNYSELNTNEKRRKLSNLEDVDEATMEDKYPYHGDTEFLSDIAQELKNIELYGTTPGTDEQYDDDERYDSTNEYRKGTELYEDGEDTYEEEAYGEEVYEGESYEDEEYEDEEYEPEGNYADEGVLDDTEDEMYEDDDEIDDTEDDLQIVDLDVTQNIKLLDDEPDAEAYDADEYEEDAEADEYEEDVEAYEADEYEEDVEAYEADEYEEDAEAYEADEYEEDAGAYEADEYEEDAEAYEADEYEEDAEAYDADGYEEDVEAYEADEYEEDPEEYESEAYEEDSEDGYDAEMYEDGSDEYCEAEEYADNAETYSEEKYTGESYDAEMYDDEEYENEADAYESIDDSYIDGEDDTYYSEEAGDEEEELYYFGQPEYSEASEKGSGKSQKADTVASIFGMKEGLFGNQKKQNRKDAYFDREDAEEDALPVMIWKKIVHTCRHFTVMDGILVSTGMIVLLIAIITGSMWVSARNGKKQLEAIAPLGQELSAMGVIGESGLLALNDAKLAAANAELVPEETEETTEQEAEEGNDVSVSFTSMEKDLKIKFSYKDTDKLVTGTEFEVILTNAKGKETSLKDTDKDGVIYESNMAAGNYDAIIKSVGDFHFPETAQKVTVKDKIEYVVVNVKDEIKSESEVNVAAEDTAQVNVVEETPTVSDTVEWVESTKTAVTDGDGYEKISKDKITDPATLSKLTTTRLLDGVNTTLDQTDISLNVGGEVTLKGNTYSDESSDTQKITYTYEWSTSDKNIASVSDGKVSAKKAGTAIITYKINKVTVTTETKYKDVVEDISAEEYDKLSDEEKAKCEEIKETSTGEDGIETETVTGYKYKHSVKDGDGEEKRTEETGSAECKVTVKEISVSSATLSLNKSDETITVGGTVTIAPSKIEYKKTDGSTESKTDSFPSITWSSDDTSIASVDSSGVVTGVKKGSTKITAKATGIKDGSGNELDIKATCKITVNAAAELTLALDKEKATVAVGKTVTIKPTVTNAAKDSSVTWKTDDKAIATVDDKGVVTGVKTGTVKITATTAEKNASTGEKVTATCTITVSTNAALDTKTLLLDNAGRQVYIKSDGKYVKAVYADYYTAEKFYILNQTYKYTGWQTIDNKTYFFDKNGKYVTGTQIIQGVEYKFSDEGVLKMNSSGGSLGIDVSKWNGSINWAAVKNSGVDFVIIRCGYRGSSTGALIQDPTFVTNIKGAKNAGLKVGVYFFTQAINEAEAVEEASMAVALSKSYGLTYPIFIDTEGSGGRADGLSKSARTAVVSAFCQTVANSGCSAGVYASKSWYETKLSAGAISQYKIWLAQYATKPTYGGRYDIWQYSSKGTVGGISGKVDMNISYLGY